MGGPGGPEHAEVLNSLAISIKKERRWRSFFIVPVTDVRLQIATDTHPLSGACPLSYLTRLAVCIHNGKGDSNYLLNLPAESA
jgi:hypothetical protein